MNTMNNYEYNEGAEFNGLIQKVMEADGVETIGASDFNAKLFENGHLGCDPLEVVDVFSTAFGDNGGGDDDKHEYVDLGLPSGTLWATENIKDENGNELYFAWGETKGYTAEQVGTNKNFTWVDYKFGNPPSKYNKDDELKVLESGDDAATVNWGSDWRMPTKADFKELTANTEYEWATVNGVQGAKFTSTVDGYTDKFLFFPAVGNALGGKVYNVGDYGNCWSVSSSDVDVYGALEIFLYGRGCGVYDNNRYYGYSVRPVRN